MINSVRNTVLYILNKENQGYISPEQFNEYATAAQLEIFESYFHNYSKAVNRRNKHLHTSGHGDVAKRIMEVIDYFTFDQILTYDGSTLRFNLPKDMYHTGTAYLPSTNIEVELVPHNKLQNLLRGHDTAPTVSYPIGAIIGDEIQVYPTSINSTGSIIMNYVRYPVDPKWTYINSSGSPVFNQSALDYQDFEIPLDDKFNLILKILSMAGVEINSQQAIQYGKAEEMLEAQQQNL
jgi:hypothetical protein